jgi:cysteine-rich repeat protein
MKKVMVLLLVLLFVVSCSRLKIEKEFVPEEGVEADFPPKNEFEKAEVVEQPAEPKPTQPAVEPKVEPTPLEIPDPIRLCGNAVVDAKETCESCPSDVQCAVDEKCKAGICTKIQLCGNGRLENGEECDDGNSVNGDGCSSVCWDEEVSCFYIDSNDQVRVASERRFYGSEKGIVVQTDKFLNSCVNETTKAIYKCGKEPFFYSGYFAGRKIAYDDCEELGCNLETKGCCKTESFKGSCDDNGVTMYNLTQTDCGEVNVTVDCSNYGLSCIQAAFESYCGVPGRRKK